MGRSNERVRDEIGEPKLNPDSAKVEALNGADYDRRKVKDEAHRLQIKDVNSDEAFYLYYVFYTRMHPDLFHDWLSTESDKIKSRHDKVLKYVNSIVEKRFKIYRDRGRKDPLGEEIDKLLLNNIVRYPHYLAAAEDEERRKAKKKTFPDYSLDTIISNDDLVAIQEKYVQNWSPSQEQSLEWVSSEPNDEIFELVDWATVMLHRAAILADQLTNKYNVQVTVIPDDSIYYSDAALENSAVHNEFYISAENCEETAKITEHLIRYSKAHQKAVLQPANTKRTEKADQKSVELNKQIDEIRQNHRINNRGKEPPLSKIAEALNELGIESPGGSKWFAQTVKRVLERTERSQTR